MLKLLDLFQPRSAGIFLGEMLSRNRQSGGAASWSRWARGKPANEGVRWFVSWLLSSGSTGATLEVVFHGVACIGITKPGVPGFWENSGNRKPVFYSVALLRKILPVLGSMEQEVIKEQGVADSKFRLTMALGPKFLLTASFPTDHLNTASSSPAPTIPVTLPAECPNQALRYRHHRR